MVLVMKSASFKSVFISNGFVFISSLSFAKEYIFSANHTA